MKKITALIITFALIFSFASCQKKEIIPSETTAAATESSQATTTASSSATTETEMSVTVSYAISSSKAKETTLRLTEKLTAAEIITNITTTAAKKTRPSTTRRNYFPNKTSTAEESTTTVTVTQTETTTRKRRTTTTEETVTENTTCQTKSAYATQTAQKNICTVTISCVQILGNKDSVKNGKEAFVPSDGYILETVEVEFKNGETTFDVLRRACVENVCSDNCAYCQNGGIQLEYEFTPGYDNYYIEGIHQIYEKDCGSKSGWMYKVNGIFPNYGCSDYKLKDGDNVEFIYTLNLGEDIGAEM